MSPAANCVACTGQEKGAAPRVVPAAVPEKVVAVWA